MNLTRYDANNPSTSHRLYKSISWYGQHITRQIFQVLPTDCTKVYHDIANTLPGKYSKYFPQIKRSVSWYSQHTKRAYFSSWTRLLHIRGLRIWKYFLQDSTQLMSTVLLNSQICLKFSSPHQGLQPKGYDYSIPMNCVGKKRKETS